MMQMMQMIGGVSASCSTCCSPSGRCESDVGAITAFRRNHSISVKR